jgi:hypothetical protein
LYRFAIDASAQDFGQAEAHVAALASGRKGLGTIVSLKSSAPTKRKASESEGRSARIGGDEERKKKTRRGGTGGKKEKASRT